MNKRLLCRLEYDSHSKWERWWVSTEGVLHYNFNDLWNDANWPTKRAVSSTTYGIIIDFISIYRVNLKIEQYAHTVGIIKMCSRNAWDWYVRRRRRHSL